MMMAIWLLTNQGPKQRSPRRLMHGISKSGTPNINLSGVAVSVASLQCRRSRKVFNSNWAACESMQEERAQSLSQDLHKKTAFVILWLRNI